jgi:sulfoxide reductase heme-binding subunit YedZ
MIAHARSSRSIPKPAPPEPGGRFPYLIIGIASIVMIAIAVAQRVLGISFSPETWYLARASGITLYLMLWLATVTGLGLTTKFFDLRLTRGLVYSLHTYGTALSFAFLAIHLLSLAIDSYTSYTLADLVVPFRISNREPWVGFGIVAMYLLVFVGVASPLRKVLGYGFWRFSHWLTFPLMVVAFAHGVGAGTDAGAAPVLAMYASTALVVVGLTVLRIVSGPRRPQMMAPSGSAPLDRMAARRT